MNTERKGEARQNVILLGASGHARVVADIIECEARFKIAGIIDSEAKIGTTIMGYPVLGRDADMPDIIERDHIFGCVVAIGDNWRRLRIAAKARARNSNLVFVTAIHPAASVSAHASVGEGSVVMAGAVVNSSARVGPHCIVNSAAIVEHDCTIDEAGSVAPGACLGGGVRVGLCAAIGLGANILPKLTIGDHVVIGAGATVIRDIPQLSVAVGTPARVIRQREAGESYL